jgi:hypothetical protein
MTTVTRDTRLIHIPTGDYPVYLRDLNTRIENACINPDRIDSEALVDFGYAPVVEVDMPPGDVVSEGAPELVDGVYKRTWIIREHTPVEEAALLKQAKDTALVAIEQLRVNEFRDGVPYQFTEGVYHVQIRSEDRINIVSLRIMAKEALAAGSPFAIKFRVAENVSVDLEAEEVVAMSDAVAAQVQAGYQAIWDLKDLTELAETIAEIPEIPTSIFSL